MMNVGDPARDRILDRDHAKARFSLGDGAERVLEGVAGERLPIRIDVLASDVRIGAGFALIGDFLNGHLCASLIGAKRSAQPRKSKPMTCSRRSRKGPVPSGPECPLKRA